MKKLFKRFIAIAFAFTLLLAPLSTPITTYAGNSNLTFVNITENSREFAYSPDPLSLTLVGNATLIDATTFDNWKIPAGKDFHFYVNLQYPTDYQIIIVDINTSAITTYNESNSSTFYVKIPATSVDNSYHVIISSSNANAYIKGWGGIWQ